MPSPHSMVAPVLVRLVDVPVHLLERGLELAADETLPSAPLAPHPCRTRAPLAIPRAPGPGCRRPPPPRIPAPSQETSDAALPTRCENPFSETPGTGSTSRKRTIRCSTLDSAPDPEKAHRCEKFPGLRGHGRERHSPYSSLASPSIPNRRKLRFWSCSVHASQAEQDWLDEEAATPALQGQGQAPFARHSMASISRPGVRWPATCSIQGGVAPLSTTFLYSVILQTVILKPR